jgi:hypothetical protein
MMPDDTPTPTPEPGSSLVPPVRRPPTAVSAPAPFPSPRERATVWFRETSVAHAAEKAVRYLFDAMDVLGDTVAEGLGLRKRPENQPTDQPPAA